MAFTAKIYGQYELNKGKGLFNLPADTIKAMLVGSGYTPNQDTHVFRSDVTSEITATGYTAGGKALANKTWVYDAATNGPVFDADDLAWTASQITGVRHIVLYKDTGTPTTSPLIAYFSETTDQGVIGTADFAITWPAAGIVTNNTP